MNVMYDGQNKVESSELSRSDVFDLVVVVRVNSDCSLGCRYCAFSRELVKPRVSIEQDVLFDLGQILQDYQHRSRRRVLVSWLGGEPFQWPDWKRQSRQFAESFGLAISVTTNGMALSKPQIRRETLLWFRELTVSIDGLAEYHDHIRQMPGLYQRLEAAIQCIVRERDPARLRLRVNTVLTRHNIAEFGDFCEEMARWGLDEITFNQLGGNDRPEFYPGNRLRPEDIGRLGDELPVIRRRVEGFGTKILGTEAYLHRLLSTSTNRSIAVSDCQPGTRFLFVDENGNVGPCNFTAAKLGIPAKALMEHGIDGLQQLFRLRRSQSLPGACGDCHATHVYAKFEN